MSAIQILWKPCNRFTSILQFSTSCMYLLSLQLLQSELLQPYVAIWYFHIEKEFEVYIARGYSWVVTKHMFQVRHVENLKRNFPASFGSNTVWELTWNTTTEPLNHVKFVLFTDCGMNCHKQCKDLVVIECKRRPKTSVPDSSPTSALASNLCTLGVKEQLHGEERSC